MLSRAERHWLADWWFTIDKLLLVTLLVLVFLGVVLSFAASPAVAERDNREAYFFVYRQIVFSSLSVLVLLGVSFLSPPQVRRIALAMFIIGVILLGATLVFGDVTKGARRWVTLAGLSLQPSEFVKPAFTILVAYLCAEQTRRPDMPGRAIAFMMIFVVVIPLMMQPDFGQTMLTTTVWGALLFMGGLSWILLILLMGLVGSGAVMAYMTFPHIRERVHVLLTPEKADTFQVDKSYESFISGGWFGLGPGEGILKRQLPDSHTDFIFAVLGEEYGIIACVILLGLFTFTVLRGLSHAHSENDPFVRLSTAGLSILFGLQAAINMASALRIMPPKGMTLPFISYGGSSTLAMAITMGFLLALTRRRPQHARFVDPAKLDLLIGRTI